MQVFPTLHSLKMHNEPQKKLQSSVNLRKTHYTMRFNRLKNEKQLSFYQKKHLENASFPFVVNNKLRAFRSQRASILNDNQLEFDSRSKAPNNKNKQGRKKAIRQFSHETLQERRFDSMPQTIKINKISLTIKQIDRFHKTQIGFKSISTLQRRNSHIDEYQIQRESKMSKTCKKQTICAWETNLPELYL